MSIIHFDRYLLRRAARRVLGRSQETPQERRLRQLPPVRPISSLTEIGASPDDWSCAHCGRPNRRWQPDCEDCGRDREAPRQVSR